MRLKSMRFFVSILFLIQFPIVRCASDYIKENNLSLLSQVREKVFTKLDSARKVNHMF